MWFCLFFLFFPLAEGGRRSCSWRSAAAGEGRQRRAKASAGRPLVVEIDGEKEATSKRGEWSAPRRKKKERQKTEETKTGKKNVSLSPRSAALCASQLNLFFNFPPFPSSTFYSSPQVRKNRRRCPRDLLSAPGVPRGTAAEQSGGFRGEGGGRAAV